MERRRSGVQAQAPGQGQVHAHAHAHAHALRSPASDHALAKEIALDALAVRQVGMRPREGQQERAHHPRSEVLLVDGAATHGLEPAHLLVEQNLATRPGLGVARRGVCTVAKSLETQP